MSQWFGPCTMLEKLSVVYRVRLVKRNRVGVLHRELLAPYQPIGSHFLLLGRAFLPSVSEDGYMDSGLFLKRSVKYALAVQSLFLFLKRDPHEICVSKEVVDFCRGNGTEASRHTHHTSATAAGHSCVRVPEDDLQNTGLHDWPCPGELVVGKQRFSAVLK